MVTHGHQKKIFRALPTTSTNPLIRSPSIHHHSTNQLSQTMNIQLQTNTLDINPIEAAPISALAVLPQPEPKKKTRNGKIARLPYLQRDLVNRLLRNNVPHDNIRGALEEYGIRVPIRNISN